MATVLFDLDRTLIDCNSGTLWLKSEWRAGRLSTWQVAHGLWWIVKYSLGDRQLDYAFQAAASTIQGQTEQAIRERTRQWFDSQVRHRLRPGAAQALQRHRDAGDDLFLATSGTVYAAEVACEAFGLVGAISTRFEVEDGVFTGRIHSLAFGPHKALRAREWAGQRGVELAEATFYSDSATDLPLLEEVGHPVVVNPDRPLARVAAERGWEVVDWGRAES